MEEKTKSNLKKAISGLLILAASYFALTISFWIEQLSNKPAASLLPDSGQGEETLQMRPNLLVIEHLGIGAPIIDAEREDEQVFQNALQKGVVHYPGTAKIGQSGNAYLFGHSSDYVWAKGDYKAVFARLPQIKPGDEIIASNSDGEKFVYIIIETLVASPKDTHLLDQHNYEKKLLTLQTSYPLGTALKRFIVIAESK